MWPFQWWTNKRCPVGQRKQFQDDSVAMPTYEKRGELVSIKDGYTKWDIWGCEFCFKHLESTTPWNLTWMLKNRHRHNHIWKEVLSKRKHQFGSLYCKFRVGGWCKDLNLKFPSPVHQCSMTALFFRYPPHSVDQCGNHHLLGLSWRWILGLRRLHLDESLDFSMTPGIMFFFHAQTKKLKLWKRWQFFLTCRKVFMDTNIRGIWRVPPINATPPPKK